jgi:DNA-binding MarR family transcriptional regulator
MAKPKQARSRTLVTDARAVLGNCAGIKLRQAERLTTRFLETGISDAGLSYAQFTLMLQVAAAADDTIAAIAERIGLDQSTLSRNLKGLSRDGLVEVTMVEADLRRRAVWLTETGARRLERAIACWSRAHDVLIGIVDPDDVGRVATAAARLADRAELPAQRTGRRSQAGATSV